MFEPKSGDDYFEVCVMVFEGEGRGEKTLSEAYETEGEALVRYNEIVAETEGTVREGDGVPIGLYATEFDVGNNTVVEVSVNDWHRV